MLRTMQAHLRDRAAERTLDALPESLASPGDVLLPLPDTRRYELPHGSAYQGGRGAAHTTLTSRWAKYTTRRRVSIDGLVTIQATVGREDVRWHLRHTSSWPILVVVQPDGRLIISDGHHRVMAAILRGDRTIDAWVYDGPFGKEG